MKVEEGYFVYYCIVYCIVYCLFIIIYHPLQYFDLHFDPGQGAENIILCSPTFHSESSCLSLKVLSQKVFSLKVLSLKVLSLKVLSLKVLSLKLLSLKVLTTHEADLLGEQCELIENLHHRLFIYFSRSWFILSTENKISLFHTHTHTPDILLFDSNVLGKSF